MIWLVTAEARAWQAAEAEKKRKRDAGGTPAHAMADGHAEFHEEERERREAQKTSRHPESGRFVPDTQHPYLADGQAADSPGNIPATARPATCWPGSDAHNATADGVRLTRVGDPQAPAPAAQATLNDQFTPDALGRFVHPGSAAVQHLPTAGAFPVPVASVPSQPPFRTAPTGSAQ